MYISKIRLEHTRCFINETIELGDSHPSLLIAGNNATGKSSILRSIAMGLCDEASAGGLLRELPGDFIRTGKDDATIEIEFTEEDGVKWFILTKLELYEKLNFERVVQRYYKNEVNKNNKGENWKDFPWEKLFIAGYGAGLRTDGTADYDQYFSGDAVYTLFKYSQTLQNPELAWRRLESAAKSSELKEKINDDISGILHNILDLDADSTVKLNPNGIFIVRDQQRKEGLESEDIKGVELGSVGDGYRAITTLIIDLLSWQLLMQNKNCEDEKNWEPLSLKKMNGIVIIDEIEKHLHPRLQRFVIKKLRDVFPKIQFIISSHSPLCVAGTADVEDKFIVYRTLSENGNNSIKRWNGGLSGLRTDQILEHFFQVPYINEGTLLDMETYSRLYLLGEKGREGQDKKTFLELTKKLSKSSQSKFLELESKLLDEIIRKQAEKIKRKIEGNND